MAEIKNLIKPVYFTIYSSGDVPELEICWYDSGVRCDDAENTTDAQEQQLECLRDHLENKWNNSDMPSKYGQLSEDMGLYDDLGALALPLGKERSPVINFADIQSTVNDWIEHYFIVLN